MISAILIFGLRGDMLASRIYRDGLRRAVADVFRVQVITNPENRGPVLTLGSTSFLHIRKSNLFVVAVTRHDVDAALVFEVLHRTVDILTTVLGHLDEQSVVRNLPTVYDVLGELVEFGYPTNTDLDSIRPFISRPTNTTISTLSSGSQGNAPSRTNTGGLGDESPAAAAVESSRSAVVSLMRSVSLKPKAAASSLASSLVPSRRHSIPNAQQTAQAASSRPWRREGIKYRRNEVFLDVLEKINFVQAQSGEVVQASVDGVVTMKTRLSGMPTCQIGFNDQAIDEADEDQNAGQLEISDDLFAGGTNDDHTPAETAKRMAYLEDFQLHQSVELRKYSRLHNIAFVPPDGEFELLRYGARKNVKMPFYVRALVNKRGETHVDYDIRIESKFPSRLTAAQLVVQVPVPPNATKTQLKSSSGKAKYKPGANSIEWTISRMSGRSSASLTGHAELMPANSQPDSEVANKPWQRPPVTLQFSISMHSCSGVDVRYLRIKEPSNYSTLKWVRYYVEAGSYEIRI